MKTRFILFLLALVCATNARAAVGTQPPGSGGGGGTTVTGSVTVLAPLVLSGTEVQLPPEIASLKTNTAVTNVHSESIGRTNGTIYSKAPEGIRGLMYWDNFQRPLLSPGVVPTSPSGHDYRLSGNPASLTNFFDLKDGYWGAGSNGALYLSISNNNAGNIGSDRRYNQFGGTFRYDYSTNGTVDGVERNVGFVLSSNADFVAKSPLYLHCGINAAGIQIQRELSSTNFINETFGGKYLAYGTNYNFTLTIISNTITVEVAGYRFQKTDPAVGLYANFPVITYESTGTPTNQLYGRWGHQWAGYAPASEYALYGGPFNWSSNFVLSALGVEGEARVQSLALTNNSGVPTLSFYDNTDTLSGAFYPAGGYIVLDFSTGFNVKDALLVEGNTTLSGELAIPLKGTNWIPYVADSGIIRTAVLSGLTLSGGVLTATGSGGAQTPWTTDIDADSNSLTNVASVQLTGTDPALVAWTDYQGGSFAITRATNASADSATTNDFQISQSATAGQVLGVHANSSGQIVLTNISTGYMLFGGQSANALSLADSTSYYSGSQWNSSTALLAVATNAAVYIPVSGRITKWFVNVRIASTLGTTEQVTNAMYNITTATAGSAANSVWDNASVQTTKTGDSLTVSAGDFVALRFQTPAWATNPLNAEWVWQAWVETP